MGLNTTSSRFLGTGVAIVDGGVGSRNRRVAVLLGFAFTGWAACTAVMGIGLAVTSLDVALVVHAVVAPIVFAILTIVYFRRFNDAGPLLTAVVFLAFVMAMDAVLIAGIVQRSFAMFASPLGTWIPFASIFGATFLAGLWQRRAKGTDPNRGMHHWKERAHESQ